MFGLFNSTIGTSNETGYDWTQSILETMGTEELGFQSVAIAPPGRTLYIEQVKLVKSHIHFRFNSGTLLYLNGFISFQAVGHCDGNDAQTELFKFYNVGQDGEVSNLRLKRHFKDGKFVDI